MTKTPSGNSGEMTDNKSIKEILNHSKETTRFDPARPFNTCGATVDECTGDVAKPVAPATTSAAKRSR